MVSPVQRYGIDVTRPRITDRPRRPWLGRMARVARPPSGDATVHSGKTASRATCGWQLLRVEATLPTPWAGRDQCRADGSPGAAIDGFGGFDVVRLCRQRTGRCSSCHCRLGNFAQIRRSGAKCVNKHKCSMDVVVVKSERGLLGVLWDSWDLVLVVWEIALSWVGG